LELERGDGSVPGDWARALPGAKIVAADAAAPVAAAKSLKKARRFFMAFILGLEEGGEDHAGCGNS